MVLPYATEAKEQQGITLSRKIRQVLNSGKQRLENQAS